VDAIEEVETRPVDQRAVDWLLFHTEEDGPSENVLQGLNHEAVIAAVFRQPEGLQHLCSAPEVQACGSSITTKLTAGTIRNISTSGGQPA
jgi:hypothetical protein